ncbi:MAG: regulatory protein RecX [Peptoniphilus sp.]|nr:regulatory protein RecX [Peptoniphilus sp.]MDY3119179.1 regulatory protein RecX [Peptoniphilus sp.]
MEIIKIKKEGTHFIVCLSNGVVLELEESVFVRHNLYKGKVLDEEVLAAISFDRLRQNGIDLALKKMRNRKTEYEIRTLLSENKFPDHVVDSVVDYLSDYGFLNDREYALLFSRDKRKINGYGPVKIAYSLRQKGVSDANITQALEEFNEDMEEALIEKIVEKKYITDGALNKDWTKIVRFLLSRGFHYGPIKQVLKQWKN